MILNGAQQCKMKFVPYKLIVLGALCHYQQINVPLVANGCTKSSTILMVAWNDIKLALLPKVTVKLKELTTVRHLRLLPSLLPCASFSAYPLFKVGIFTNLTLAMPSYMVTYTRMFTCSFLLVSEERGRHEFANCTSHCMDLNRHQGNGSSNYPMLSGKPVFNNPGQIILYLPEIIKAILQSCWCTLMI